MSATDELRTWAAERVPIVRKQIEKIADNIDAEFERVAKAVEGTLERGECEVYEDEASCAVFGVRMEYTCRECETSFVAWKPDEYDGQIDVKPNFCPSCGLAVRR